MLTVVTWCWGDKYGHDDVSKLASGVRRNLKQPHRFICFTDGVIYIDVKCAQIEDPYLTRMIGCYARLRMFDPGWQAKHGLDDRFVCMDLDTVITGPLDPLFDRPEEFVILQGGNFANPCPYGGALMMLRPGVHPEVWSEFTIEAASKAPFYQFPDDQGWIAHKVPGAAGWKVGPQSGVYVFRKPQWPNSDVLPNDARLVTFNGWRTPAKFAHLRWVKKNWAVHDRSRESLPVHS